jgi:hypothetical protein
MSEDEEFQGRPATRRHVSMEDLILETELRVAREKEIDLFRCPCRKCHGGHKYSVETIRTHLRLHTQDIHLTYSMVGGDPDGGFPEEGI